MGPLTGVRVIEMGGIGPSPFAAMLMADLGAEVIRIDRYSSEAANPYEVTLRSRKCMAVNIKDPQGIEIVKQLVQTADVIMEGFRPGVMEKLGLGPEQLLAINPKLVYGRMTGWGQEGPMSQVAGHDINYVAVTGALDTIGRAEGGPVPPLNLLGDFAGGGSYLVMGMLAALLHAQKSGQGQVVDASINDGVANLMNMILGYRGMGMWDQQRQNNIFDGGAHYYDTYECADGKWVSIGAIEIHFYELLVESMGLTEQVGEMSYDAQFDKQKWHALRPVFAKRFKEKTRDEWTDILGMLDVCYAPVLSMDEAMAYPQHIARNTYVEVDGVKQGAPAPKFSETPTAVKTGPRAQGADNAALMQELGYSASQITELIENKVLV
ncbi:MAG: CoA transferase [Pseudomonadales bacterium]|nr:CoA transferase [Pseudomonadales bacterium]